jgi:hypothetical protein
LAPGFEIGLQSLIRTDSVSRRANSRFYIKTFRLWGANPINILLSVTGMMWSAL